MHSSIFSLLGGGTMVVWPLYVDVGLLSSLPIILVIGRTKQDMHNKNIRRQFKVVKVCDRWYRWLGGFMCS